MRTALDRNQARRPAGCRRARLWRKTRSVSLLALNGLRVSEAIGADIDQLGLAEVTEPAQPSPGGPHRHHPRGPSHGSGHDLVIGELFDRVPRFHGIGWEPSVLPRPAGRIVGRVARRAGITKPVGPHTLRHAFIDNHWLQQWSLCHSCCRGRGRQNELGFGDGAGGPDVVSGVSQRQLRVGGGGFVEM